MLHELSKRINNPQDLQRLVELLYERVLILENLDNSISSNAFYFGLFHAYQDHIYRYLVYHKLPIIDQYHLYRFDWCMSWLSRNEKIICQALDQMFVNYFEIMQIAKLTKSFSNN